MKSLSAILLLALLISCTKILIEEPVIKKASVTAFQQAMFDEINYARTKPADYAEQRLKSYRMAETDNGSYLYLTSLSPVAAVSFNSTLNKSATDYASFLAANNVFGHLEDTTPALRALRAGYTGTIVGENLAAAQPDSYNALVNAQTAAIYFVRDIIIDNGIPDLSHRLILLNNKYTSLGIGSARNTSSNYINYCVQNFGN